MAKPNPGNYLYYRVTGLPAGKFGETYVIAAGMISDDGTHRLECFVLSKRHKPHLHQDAFEFRRSDAQVPEELTIDEEFLLSEARLRAQTYLDEALFELSEKHGEDVLLRYSANLVEIKSMPLMHFWMRGELTDEIRAVAKETKIPRLKLRLSLVMQDARLKPG